MSQDEALPPVLTASVHDVRYFAALLRGVNFVNHSSVLVTENGLTITVEEARTLVGNAFIVSNIFDEYAFHPEPRPAPQIRAQPERSTKAKGKQKQTAPDLSETDSESDDNNAKDVDWKNSEDPSQPVRPALDDENEDEPNNAAFGIPLNTLLECLNIFGTAGPSTSTGGKGGRGWHRNADSDHEDRERRQDGIEAFFGVQEKRTSMRMSYLGAGHPLTLIIAEDATGPTTTCEITTFESEPQLQLNFDVSKVVLKVILKSSWLRDALSELDPSCEKLTFIGNPPRVPDAAQDGPRHAQRKAPMLRIQATGAFGSTEMDYPNDREVLETFDCTRNVNFSYRFTHISRTLRALQSSTKASLRVDEDGLLSIQFLMPSPKPKIGHGVHDGFIEFRCLALEEDI